MSDIVFPPLDVRLPCASDPELFTRDKWVGPGVRAEIRAAKDLCAVCPFIAECLEYAMKSRDMYSILGGLTPRQRDKIRYGKKAA